MRNVKIKYVDGHEEMIRMDEKEINKYILEHPEVEEMSCAYFKEDDFIDTRNQVENEGETMVG